MARRPVSQQQPRSLSESTNTEWLKLVPKSIAADVATLLEKKAETLRAEREMALQKARELDAQLRELGIATDGSAVAKANVEIAAPARTEEKPSSEWSVLRLVKYYLKSHPRSLAGDVVQFVTSVRPGESDTLSILYKYSKPEGVLEKTGERRSYRYSLKEGASE